MNYFLDAAEANLHAAWVNDAATAELKQAITHTIQVVQMMKKPAKPLPLKLRLDALGKATMGTIELINCHPCYMTAWHGLARKVNVHYYFETGQIWRAVKEEFVSDLKRDFWLLRAAWARLRK